MTKTKKKRSSGAPTGRLVSEREDVFLAGLLCSLTGETHAELVKRFMREPMKRQLRAKNIDPDERLADFQARNRN